MVDVEQLRAVKTITEAGSITAAARQLCMSQPGLSRLVERVEDEFDTRLFSRGRGGASLTVDGRRFLEFARETLTHYDMLKAAIGGHGRRPGGVRRILRVVASTTPGEYLLPQIASQFSLEHPNVTIETLITGSAGVANMLLSGDYDIGFSGRRSDFADLRYMKIATDEVVLAVSASHPFAKAGEIDISELENQRMLRRESGSGTYESVEAVLHQQGKSLPESGYELSLGSTQAVLSAVDSELGIGFVTLRAIQHHAPSRIVAVRIKGAPVKRDLYLVQPTARAMTDTAREFVRYIEQLDINSAS